MKGSFGLTTTPFFKGNKNKSPLSSLNLGNKNNLISQITSINSKTPLYPPKRTTRETPEIVSEELDSQDD